MRLAILYDDKEVFVAYKPQEFVKVLQKLIDDGKTVQEAIDIMIVKLKRETLKK